MSDADPRRSEPITLTWAGRIGRLEIDGALWAAVEWSEKRQAWCVEDAEGRCLTHAASIHGQASSKEEAVALATAMIRDGRMPSPEEARQRREERRRIGREQRQRQPSYQRQRQERKEWQAWLAARFNEDWKERGEPPLYLALDQVFDLADPDLWRSNMFASLRPRFTAHLRAVVARLEFEICDATAAPGRRRRRRDPEKYGQLQQQLDRAKKILIALEKGDA